MKVYNKRHNDAPADAVYIGRGSKWGNPFVIGKDGSREEVIARYRTYLINNEELMSALPELRGKDLVCYCAPAAYHGDILLEATNKGEEVIKDKPFIIAVTGHRSRDLTESQQKHAYDSMKDLLIGAQGKYGSRLRVLSGMADGIDKMAAHLCCELGIEWTACIPHKSYFSTYAPYGTDQVQYWDEIEDLLAKATKIVYVVDESKPWHYKHNFTRNEYMLQWADAVLACAKFSMDNIPSKGGTAHMCRTTQKSGKKIVHVQL